ncbi:MAG TPA: TolC family protein [Chroococcales cyanobacterium]|jgi:outer membrane protein TolC
MKFSIIPLVLLCCLPAYAAEPVLTLEQSLGTAQAHQPQLVRAQAAVAAARAHTESANASLMPQLSFGASYNQPTGREGTSFFPGSALNLRANQMIFDFGQRSNRLQAANALLDGQQQTERLNRQQVALGVRTGFFSVRAAQEAYAKQQHLGFRQRRDPSPHRPGAGTQGSRQCPGPAHQRPECL